MSRFDDQARTWDTPEHRARAEELADVIRTEVRLTPTTRLVDVGAGTGLLGLALVPDVGSVTLAEPSAGMLEVLREKIDAMGDPSVRVLPFDLLAGAPPSEPFDLAVSLLVLHHLPDTVAALRAISALLAPGGRIAIADLAAEDGSFHADPDGIHHQGFEPATLIGAAEDAGFTDPRIVPAMTIEREGRPFPVLLLIATRP